MTIGGAVHWGTRRALAAKKDLAEAYDDAAGQTAPDILVDATRWTNPQGTSTGRSPAAHRAG